MLKVNVEKVYGKLDFEELFKLVIETKLENIKSMLMEEDRLRDSKIIANKGKQYE